MTLLDDDSRGWPPMISAFLRFHCIFMIRCILFELGGIQGSVALPGDSVFNQFDNKYDKPSFERLRNEFGLDENVDFRYTDGTSHGLGEIYLWYSGSGPLVYRAGTPYPNKYFLFTDEGGSKYSGNRVYYITKKVERPYNSFVVEKGLGLTKPGLARLNRSIEAFVYCVLGSQVNTRSSIVGDSGSAQETQAEFIVLFESAIIESSITKSIQRYQMAIQQSNVKLDLAISPNCWLVPGRMIINTETVIGYNNKLQKATAGMKFGMNDINSKTKVVKHDDMGGSKTKLPHSNN